MSEKERGEAAPPKLHLGGVDARAGEKGHGGVGAPVIDRALMAP